MRDETLGQPAGGILLQEVLGHAQYALRNSTYNMPLSYKMDMGYIGKYGTIKKRPGTNETELHMPSYNLVLYYGRTPFFVGHYELDRRFSLEVSEEEAERIEDFMANEILGIFACNGVLFYIGARVHSSSLMSIIRKESDDKKFLPLN